MTTSKRVAPDWYEGSEEQKVVASLGREEAQPLPALTDDELLEAAGYVRSLTIREAILEIEAKNSYLKGCVATAKRRGERIKQLEAELSRLSAPKEGGWKSIEFGLPKMDGTLYWTYRQGYNERNADKNGYELDTAQGQSMWHTYCEHGFGITHYMLPTPPDSRKD